MCLMMTCNIISLCPSAHLRLRAAGAVAGGDHGRHACRRLGHAEGIVPVRVCVFEWCVCMLECVCVWGVFVSVDLCTQRCGHQACSCARLPRVCGANPAAVLCCAMPHGPPRLCFLNLSSPSRRLLPSWLVSMNWCAAQELTSLSSGTWGAGACQLTVSAVASEGHVKQASIGPCRITKEHTRSSNPCAVL